MLGDNDAVATLAVKDMQKTKKFYEATLGLSKVGGNDQMGIAYKSGNSTIFVYPSEYAGTNKATAVGWVVGEDLDKIVNDLKGKGVSFEQYDNLPGVTREDDIHVMGDMRAVWFKDPDGNILNIIDNM